MGLGLFHPITNNRKRKNGLKSHQERFRFYVKKYLFTKRVNRLPREVLKSLVVFKTHVDVSFRDTA